MKLSEFIHRTIAVLDYLLSLGAKETKIDFYAKA